MEKKSQTRRYWIERQITTANAYRNSGLTSTFNNRISCLALKYKSIVVLPIPLHGVSIRTAMSAKRQLL